jgi:hypothetical protein
VHRFAGKSASRVLLKDNLAVIRFSQVSRVRVIRVCHDSRVRQGYSDFKGYQGYMFIRVIRFTHDSRARLGCW